MNRLLLKEACSWSLCGNFKAIVVEVLGRLRYLEIRVLLGLVSAVFNTIWNKPLRRRWFSDRTVEKDSQTLSAHTERAVAIYFAIVINIQSVIALTRLLKWRQRALI